MNLNTQIVTLLFSFLYGIFCGLFLKYNRKIIYHKKRIIKYLGSFLVVFICLLLYFIILKRINNAFFHPYCLIVSTVGIWLINYIDKQIKK